MTLWPTPDLPAIQQQQGQNFFTAAFITADTSKNAATAPPNQIPAWGGQSADPVSSGFLSSSITQIRSQGGDVMVSFGGEAGTELALYITDPSRLAAAYQSVVDQYSLTKIDFDIEGAAVADHASIDRRSAAIKQLQNTAIANGGNLDVWLTLPALPTGLTADGQYVVQSALAAGVQLAGVNIMTMDFGDSAAPNPAGKMGTYVIQAGNSLFGQLQTLYQNAHITKTTAQIWSLIGITPMIGVNDTTDEVFQISDAAAVESWAVQNGVGRLSFWSVSRDFPATSSTLGKAGPTDSGINQNPYDFTHAFQPFTGVAVASLSVTNAVASGGNGGSETLGFSVQLQPAAIQTVTVHYATADGTAIAGRDYLATSGTLTFNPGDTSKTVNVNFLGNTHDLAGATFYLNLSAAQGAPVLQSRGKAVVADFDSPGQFAAAASFSVTGQWTGGYQGEIDFTPVQSLSTWTLVVNAPSGIASIWGAQILNQSGTKYTLGPVSWNAQVTAGTAVNIGFTANGNVSWPSNLSLNGQSIIFDSDHDGLDDGWEMQNFGSLTASDGTGDSDRDGQSDMVEFVAGTSPVSGAEAFQASVKIVNGLPQISWKATSGRRYEVQWASSPSATATWQTIASQMKGSGTLNYTDLAAGNLTSPRFYRVKALFP
jgi:chitinase